jgi:hypothetical protein
VKFNETSDEVFNDRPDGKSDGAFDEDKADKIFDKIIDGKPVAKV